MKRFVICLAATFSVIFGCDEAENALMELAAISIAGIVWAFWNMVSPEKEEEKELFKYEGAKDWMKKTDWDQCMAAIDND